MGTEVVKLACQGCGADLAVDGDVRFVTCNFCGSKLEVVHDQTVTHTRLLEDIADDLEVIQIQNELSQIERQWDREREGYQTTDKRGHRSVPSAAGSVIGGVVAIVFGIGWMIFASNMGAPAFFPLFGLVFIAAALIGMVRSAGKASGHRSAQADYQARRAELLGRLERARGRK